MSSHDNQPTPDDPMQGHASYMIQLGCALLLFSLSFSPPALEVDYPLLQLIITFLHCPTGLAAYIPYCSLSHYLNFISSFSSPHLAGTVLLYGSSGLPRLIIRFIITFRIKQAFGHQHTFFLQRVLIFDDQ
jgi:hypothetical protein